MQPVALKHGRPISTTKLLDTDQEAPGIKVNEVDKDAFIEASKADL